MTRSILSLVFALGLSGCDLSDNHCDEEGRVTLYGQCTVDWECQRDGAGDVCYQGQCTNECEHDPNPNEPNECEPFGEKKAICDGICILQCFTDEGCPDSMTCEQIVGAVRSRCV